MAARQPPQPPQQQQPPPQAPPMEPEAPDSRKRPLETPPEVVCTKRSNTGGEKGPRFGAGAIAFSVLLERPVGVVKMQQILLKWG